jgi:hypothetical protein
MTGPVAGFFVSKGMSTNPTATYPRSGLCLAPLARRGLGMWTDRQGRLYSVELLTANRPDTAEAAFVGGGRATLLLGLAFRFLLLALQATLAQAKASPAIRWYRRAKLIRHPTVG